MSEPWRPYRWNNVARRAQITSRWGARDTDHCAFKVTQLVRSWGQTWWPWKVIFTWNGCVNCGKACWFCCKSLFWLSILSKLMICSCCSYCSYCYVRVLCFIMCSVHWLVSNFIFWEVCSCEVRFFRSEFHESWVPWTRKWRILYRLPPSGEVPYREGERSMGERPSESRYHTELSSSYHPHRDLLHY